MCRGSLMTTYTYIKVVKFKVLVRKAKKLFMESYFLLGQFNPQIGYHQVRRTLAPPFNPRNPRLDMWLVKYASKNFINIGKTISRFLVYYHSVL